MSNPTNKGIPLYQNFSNKILCVHFLRTSLLFVLRFQLWNLWIHHGQSILAYLDYYLKKGLIHLQVILRFHYSKGLQCVFFYIEKSML